MGALTDNELLIFCYGMEAKILQGIGRIYTDFQHTDDDLAEAARGLRLISSELEARISESKGGQPSKV